MLTMEQYNVTGMSCAACQARVEKAVSALPKVSSCTVSLLTNSMRVEGAADSKDIIKAVEDAGYGASLKKDALTADDLEDKETGRMVKRLVLSVIFLLVLMYFSMGVHMFAFPAPKMIAGDHFAMGIVQLVLTVIIMVINRKFFTSGFKALIHRAPNMDSLIATGAAASFIYSFFVLIFPGWAGSDDLYFESAAMILTLVTVGKTLEAYSKGRTTDALKNLMKLAPKTANVIRDGREITVPVKEIAVGDVFIVRPGESFPVDGVVIEGVTAVDESALTGESIPVDKETGSRVSSATINQAGAVKCRATRVGEDTTISQIIALVSDAAATKAPVAKLADRISGVFVPVVMIISLMVLIVWLAMGQSIGYALARAVSVLVVSCPCALGLATPVAIMVGNGVGARSGILFKNAEALQETGSVVTVALDKTGTITNGKPKVTDVICADGIPEDDLILAAASLEALSEHPLAHAVTSYAEKFKDDLLKISDFKALPGNGLEGVSEEGTITGGSIRYMESLITLPAEFKKKTEEVSEGGKTPMLFAKDGRLLGMIAVADTIKEESIRAIEELKGLGVRCVMLTGDNEKTAQAIASVVGVDETVAGVLPEGKEEIIRRLQKEGKCAMVGDGINDAPALTRADTGIAIGAGADVAIDAADVVLVKSDPLDIAAAIRLSRKTYRNIKENLFWALFYNVLLIPLACGLYSKWGLVMTPAWGAAAMSVSSIFVVLNALRLNLADIYDASYDKAVAKNKTSGLKTERDKGRKTMTKKVKIEGMMCAHCEANVKKALEAIDGVESADVSHESGEALIGLSKDVDEAVIRKAIEDRDYRFVSMEG